MPPNDLSAAVVSHNNLVAQIRAAFPDETEESLADTIMGETQLDGAIIAVLRYALEREAHGKAIGELVDGMTARRRRLEDGAKSLRLAALHAMTEAGMKKLAAPDMTVSVRQGKARIIIRDETEIPVHLCRSTVEPNKILIAAAIAAGDDVPGVTLGNPVPVLSIHRS